MAKWALLGAAGYGLILVLSKQVERVVWPLIGVIFFLLISADFALQAHSSNVGSRVLQHRLFGILYLGYAAVACVLVLHLRF